MIGRFLCYFGFHNWGPTMNRRRYCGRVRCWVSQHIEFYPNRRHEWVDD